MEKIQAVIMLVAEEIDITGENKERLIESLKQMKKLSKAVPLVIASTRLHDKAFRKYFYNKKTENRVIYLSNRKFTSTRTQIKDLFIFLKKNTLSNILIVTHAYHIPRTSRYCKKFLKKINYYFWPVGEVKNQTQQVEKEIKKIIKYRSLGHL